ILKKNHYEVGKLSISAQRYPFCTQAFVELLNNEHFENFEFTYKETDMDKVIENVSSQKSDIGIIFLRDITEKFMNKILASHDLEFIELTRIKPHVFLSTDHPLANKTEISTKELIDFPYVVFARNNNISYNYSEEVIFHTINEFGKVIYINDRATAYNIISNSHCFSTGSGLLPSKYCPNNLKAIPLSNDTDLMRLGWVKLIDMPINPLALKFIDILKNIIIK
ncbi:MAG: LysR family transcriptional regulator substrate-binding protein, partial [Anaerotignaceae bacterium]